MVLISLVAQLHLTPIPFAKNGKQKLLPTSKNGKGIVSSLTDFSAATIEAAFKTYLAEKELGIGAVLLPYRLVLTGVGAGPGMFEISEFLGKEEVISRIDLGLTTIEKMLHEA
jgi:glutamyl-tRNA synthetase